MRKSLIVLVSLFAAGQAPRPAFDAVSVKVNPAKDGLTRVATFPTRFSAANATLHLLVRYPASGQLGQACAALTPRSKRRPKKEFPGVKPGADSCNAAGRSYFFGLRAMSAEVRILALRHQREIGFLP